MEVAARLHGSLLSCPVISATDKPERRQAKLEVEMRILLSGHHRDTLESPRSTGTAVAGRTNQEQGKTAGFHAGV